MKRTKDFTLMLAPTAIENGYRRMSEEETTKLKEGYITEERLATNVCEPCPVCGERYFRSYYEQRCYSPERFQRNQNRLTKQSLSGDLNEDKAKLTDRGLLVSEKEIHKALSKDTWYIKDYSCTTCRSMYRSRPYRKDRYVKLR